MHDPAGVYPYNGFRSGWALAQSILVPFPFVVSPPLFNQDLDLFEAVQDLAVGRLIAKPDTETPAVAVLPRWPWLDLGCPGTDGNDPVPNHLRHELQAIVQPDEGR